MIQVNIKSQKTRLVRRNGVGKVPNPRPKEATEAVAKVWAEGAAVSIEPALRVVPSRSTSRSSLASRGSLTRSRSTTSMDSLGLLSSDDGARSSLGKDSSSKRGSRFGSIRRGRSSKTVSAQPVPSADAAAREAALVGVAGRIEAPTGDWDGLETVPTTEKVPVYYLRQEGGRWLPLPDRFNRAAEHAWRIRRSELSIPTTLLPDACAAAGRNAMLTLGPAAPVPSDDPDAVQFGFALVEVSGPVVARVSAVRRGDPGDTSVADANDIGQAGSSKADPAADGVVHKPVPKEEVELAIRLCVKHCNELIETETVYYEALDALAHVFKEPLTEWAAVLMKTDPEHDAVKNGTIAMDEITLIFDNIPSILQVSGEILESLRAAIEVASAGPYGGGGIPAALSKVLSDAAQRSLKLYIPTFRRFTAANAKLADIRSKERRPLLFDILRILELQPGGGKKNRLDGLIIQPMQRLPRYVLMLRDIKRQVLVLEQASGAQGAEAPDPAECGPTQNAVEYANVAPGTIEALDDAIARVDAVILEASRGELDTEQRKRAFEFVNVDINCPELHNPTRRMIKEGLATKVRKATSGMGSMKFKSGRKSGAGIHRSDRKLHLANDMIFVSKSSKDGKYGSGAVYCFPLSTLVMVSAAAAYHQLVAGALVNEQCWHLNPMFQILATLRIDPVALLPDEQQKVMLVGAKNKGFILLEFKSAAECKEWTDEIAIVAAAFAEENRRALSDPSRAAQTAERLRQLEVKPSAKTIADEKTDTLLEDAIVSVIRSIHNRTSDTPYSVPPATIFGGDTSSAAAAAGGGGLQKHDLEIFIAMSKASRATATAFAQVHADRRLDELIKLWHTRANADRYIAPVDGSVA